MTKNIEEKNKAKRMTKRKGFMFVFTLIQNSTEVQKVAWLLKHIHIMFNYLQLDDVALNSIHIISKEIIGTDLDENEIFLKRTHLENHRDQFFNEIKIRQLELEGGKNFLNTRLKSNVHSCLVARKNWSDYSSSLI